MLWDIHPRMELPALGRINPVLVLKGNAKLFCRVAVSFYISISNVRVTDFLHVLTSI